MKRALFAVLLAFIGTCEAQDVGRLFFTPEQRAALDARRKARVPDRPAAAPVVASPTTRLDGFVRRSDGRNTVWVNGESLDDAGPEAPRIEAGRSTDARVSITLGDGGSRATLKPGQVLDRGTGEVRDGLGSGEIQVRRRP